MVCDNENDFLVFFDVINNCFKFKDVCFKVFFFQVKFERLVLFFYWGEMFLDLVFVFMGMNYVGCIFKLFSLCVYFFEIKNSMY